MVRASVIEVLAADKSWDSGSLMSTKPRKKEHAFSRDNLRIVLNDCELCAIDAISFHLYRSAAHENP